MRRNDILVSGLVVTASLVIGTRSASATFHLWDIDEVFSNADGSVQFIELKTSSFSQNSLFEEEFTTNANLFTFPNDLFGSTANKRFLMATAAFSLLPGAVTPDYIIPSNFFTISGDTLTLVTADSWTPAITIPTDGITSLSRDGTFNVNSPTNFAGEVGSVPEPGSLALLGAAALTLLRRRRRTLLP